MIARIYLGSAEINPPINLGELIVGLKYSSEDRSSSITLTTLELGVGKPNDVKDGATISIAQIDSGVSGGIGVFEGMPCTIVLDDERSKKFDLFVGYMDLSKATVECSLVNAPLTEEGGIDWLNDVADSFSYDYLFAIGELTKEDAFGIPYVKNKKQSAGEVFVAILSGFVLVQAIRQSIKNISQWSGNASSVINAIGGIISLIIEILYLITLFVALIKLLIDLFNMLIQPVKYHYVMYVYDLLRIGFSHLNIKFSSSILEQAPFNKLAVLPQKYNIKEDNTGILSVVAGFFLGNPNEQFGYVKSTFGELLRAIKSEVFDAQLLIENGVAYLEPYGFKLSSSVWTLPNIETPAYTFNSNEFVSNYYITFDVDTTDRNTIQLYKGTSVQVVAKPKFVNNPNMVLMTGLKEVRIPFALGKSKTALNEIELVVSAFLKVLQAITNVIVQIVNAILKTINAIIKAIKKLIKRLNTIGIKIKINIRPVPLLKAPNIKNLIKDRIGMLMMESDYVSTPKLLLVERMSNERNNKLVSNHADILNARYLYENYHYINSFVGRGSYIGNQYLIENFENIPFCFEDYEKVRLNRFIQTSNGEEAELVSLDFNPIEQTASGQYRRHKVYTQNITETIIEDDGK